MKPWTPRTATTRAPSRAGREVVLADPVDEPVPPSANEASEQRSPRTTPAVWIGCGQKPASTWSASRVSRSGEYRDASLPRRVPDVDLHDRGAAREDERLRELLPADRAEHRLHRLAAVRVEGAPEIRDRDPGEPAEHAVDQPGGQRPPPGVAPRCAPAAGDIVPRPTASTSAGTSSGGFWRSPSMVTTIPPRARERPACIAGCCPEFRLRRTARTCARPRGCARGQRTSHRSSRRRRRGSRRPAERPSVAVEALLELVERRDLVEERHDDGQLGREARVHGARGALRVSGRDMARSVPR